MTGYHKYVFDTARRSFVGEFEEMYRHEGSDGFDSWHQEDSRQLNRKVALALLEEWNFGRVVDIGVGKGALTHRLKRRNNVVAGLDISPTAIEVARSRYPDIDFAALDVNDLEAVEAYLRERHETWGGIDLVFTSECLSYLSNWRELLALLSRYSRYLMVFLYLPEDPIGFVKSEAELLAAVADHFVPLEEVSLRRSRFTVVFGESREG
ncbi:class I SAM-dependent methyltransferase [Endothiovibrio diazotrophicus]